MTRSKKKRIGKIIYWFLLTVYTVTLIAVILLVLNDWRKYLIAYEDSQSKVVIENYMDNLKGGTWGEKVTEAVSSMEHPFQTNEECKELVDILDLDHDLGDFAKDGGDAIKLIDWLVGTKKFYKINLHTMNNAEKIKFVPPKLRNGRGCPVVGKSPVLTHT